MLENVAVLPKLFNYEPGPISLGTQYFYLLSFCVVFLQTLELCGYNAFVGGICRVFPGEFINNLVVVAWTLRYFQVQLCDNGNYPRPFFQIALNYYHRLGW